MLFVDYPLEQVLCPDDAMNRLRGCIPNGASGKGLLRCLGRALVALRESFLDQLNLTVVASGAAFNQWDTSGQTHPVDMISRRSIVQGVQDERKGLKVAHAKAIPGRRREDSVSIKKPGRLVYVLTR